MKKLTLLLIISLCIGISSTFSQQLKEFSAEHNKFLNELTKFMTQSQSIKKEEKDIIDEFKDVWEEGNFFSLEQKNSIIKTSNALLKKKGRPSPHFIIYINSLNEFSKETFSEANYIEWEKTINYMTGVRKIPLRNIERFLKTSFELFTKNTICKSSTIQWNADTDNFDLKFVDNTLKVNFPYAFNIVCFAKKDSINIYNTKGTFDVLKKTWEGESGTVSWIRSGFSKDKVYAKLNSYNINMTKSNYEADSVLFVNKNYFNEPLLGKLSDKVQAVISEERTSYPKFESYTNRFQLDNIYENVNYDGGFTMHGSKFIGSGDNKELAKLTFLSDDKEVLTASAKRYTFRADRITSQNTSITLRLDSDSIYHPGLLFKYFVEKKKVELIRNNKGMAKAPFYNTYHMIDMDVEQITWKTDEPKINLTMLKGASKSTAIFESANYFSADKFNKIQGMDKLHPLIGLRRFAKEYGINEFTALEYATFLRMPLTQVKHVLMSLSYQGIIIYNTETDRVIIKKKLYEYLNASVGKVDYDVIQFTSTTSDTLNKGSINLLNYHLKINGVREIYISDSQDVVIYPAKQEILLKKNRDFEFNGKIKVGYFLVVGNNFNFKYDQFKINLNDVRYVKMQAPTGKLDAYGFDERKTVLTKIENINGDLLIDNPFNKSGVQDFPDYPIFNSKKDAYVYYDGKSIQKGTYKRENFHFQVYPFTIDSLNNITKDGLKFPGYFTSGDIFPPFEDSLTVQEDYSLGFKRSTPPGGFAVYKGKGNYDNNIQLSHKGLRGDGTLNYITSTTFSDNFVFFPDSMNTHAKNFIIKSQKSGVEFPSVNGLHVYEHWEPYNDKMFTSKKEVPLTMYDGNSVLHGMLVTQPNGLSGNGKLEFEEAVLISNLFDFKHRTFDSDTSSFSLKAADLEGFAFKTDNVNSHIDFDQRIGEFKSNGEASFVEFPKNEYICYMDQFTWYMDKDEIEMSTSQDALALKQSDTELSPTELEDIQLEGSEFVSINPRQDSLRFKAPSAKYSLVKHLITAKDVKWIRVADATIFPGNGEVIVEKKAKMRTLNEAKIMANNVSRYHTIFDATINIYGRKDYNGSGDYNYIDENNLKQKIHLNLITVDSTIQTYATGSIGITENFTISPSFEYTGDVRLNASEEFLTFTGASKMRHNCDTISKKWIKFSAPINPKEIYIPIAEEIKSINNDNLFVGPFITRDSTHIYSTFLTNRRKYNDHQLITTGGYLTFDKSDGKFKISNKDKLVEFNLPGNYMSIHKDICNVYAEGKIELVKELGQVKMNTVGNFSHDIEKDDVSLELIMGLNFMFNDQCIKILSETILNNSALGAVETDSDVFTKGITELLGQEKADKVISDMSLGFLKKVPKELNYTLFLTDLKLEWNSETKSYRSVGPIGIGNINKTQVNRYVNGKFELIKKRSGDIMHLYIDMDGTWFFFTYARTQMLGSSSIKEFNEIIKQMKPDKRKMNVKKGEKPYSFYINPESSRKKFLKTFEVEEEEDNSEYEY